MLLTPLTWRKILLSDTISHKRTISIFAGDSVTCHLGSLDGYYIARKKTENGSQKKLLLMNA